MVSIVLGYWGPPEGRRRRQFLCQISGANYTVADLRLLVRAIAMVYGYDILGIAALLASLFELAAKQGKDGFVAIIFNDEFVYLLVEQLWVPGIFCFGWGCDVKDQKRAMGF